MNGTPVCVDLVSIIDASSHAVGTGSAGMQGVVKGIVNFMCVCVCVHVVHACISQ